MNFLKTLKPLSIITLTLFALNACNTANSGDGALKDVAVTMQIQSSPQKMKAVTVDSLTEVKFLVEELELESVSDDSLDFEVENQVVQLPLDGSELTLTSQQIPDGLYDEFEMEIEHDDEQTVNDADFTDGDMRYSIVIKGIYDGEPFMFRTNKEFEIELDLEPAIEISETTNNAAIAIKLDTSGWFKNENGEALNPGDPMNQETITQNIANSFEAHGEHDDADDLDTDTDD
jgi:hypothetical protein